jgi:hypothetical protein
MVVVVKQRLLLTAKRLVQYGRIVRLGGSPLEYEEGGVAEFDCFELLAETVKLPLVVVLFDAEALGEFFRLRE